MLSLAIFLVIGVIILTFVYLVGVRLETKDFRLEPYPTACFLWLATYNQGPFALRLFFDWFVLYFLCVFIFSDLPKGSPERYLCKKYLWGFPLLLVELLAASGLIYLKFGGN